MTRPEILSPAGAPDRLDAALLYGADAVYLAGNDFGMRAAAGNFTGDELRHAVEKAHAAGARVYVTANTMPRGDEAKRIPEFVEFLEDIKADAIIAADLGVAMMVKKRAPHCELHVSTQASVCNAAAARAWHDIGASRVILARELSLDEISDIRAETSPKLELEVFVHGAMCVSYSGRCLLSSYLTGRDANRGQCAQPCRWSYALTEEKRPGEYMPIYEDETGTYILNSKDLNMLANIPALVSAGASSFKIEGRMKTSYYTAAVTNAYCSALKEYLALPESFAPEKWETELLKVSHREYCTGFYYGDNGKTQHYKSAGYVRVCEAAADVVSCDGASALLRQKNKTENGDELELLLPGRPGIAFIAENMRDVDGNCICATPHPHMLYRMELPETAPAGAVIRRALK